MPTYDYDCPHCGVFDAVRPISQRNAAIACPFCDGQAERTIVAAPVLGSLSAAARTAHATNERAANEPKRSGSHGSGCGCCSTSVKFPTASDAPGAPRSSSNGRPWMLSH